LIGFVTARHRLFPFQTQSLVTISSVKTRQHCPFTFCHVSASCVFVVRACIGL